MFISSQCGSQIILQGSVPVIRILFGPVSQSKLSSECNPSNSIGSIFFLGPLLFMTSWKYRSILWPVPSSNPGPSSYIITTELSRNVQNLKVDGVVDWSWMVGESGDAQNRRWMVRLEGRMVVEEMCRMKMDGGVSLNMTNCWFVFMGCWLNLKKLLFLL